MAAMPRTSPIKTTVFDHMSGLARDLGAINLGQGFPDAEHAPELLAAAQRALVGKPNQYPPMRGLPELRAGVCDYYARRQGLALDPAQVVITSGATEALAAAIYAFVQPGDEAIVLQPCYDAYIPLIERAGGTAVPVNLAPPHWTIPFDALAAAITPRTRLIIANTPNNPTGTLLTRADFEQLGALCEAHDIVLLCDEVWEGMIFSGDPHVSPLHVPSLKDRAIKVGSAGKLFSLTGWKVGWAVAAPPLADMVAAQHQFLTFTTATPLQWAVTEGLALPDEWHDAHAAIYAPRRAQLIAGLEAAGYVVLPSAGTWFVTVDLKASGLPADDEAVAEKLIREAGVASIPVSAFYRNDALRGYLRLCFAKQEGVLDEALERLARFRGGF
jgi:N-succinyldiaminopimelate aminotransferase